MHSPRQLGSMPSLLSKDLLTSPTGMTMKARRNIEVFRRYRMNPDSRAIRSTQRRTILPSVTSPLTSNECDYTDVFDVKM